MPYAYVAFSTEECMSSFNYIAEWAAVRKLSIKKWKEYTQRMQRI